MHVNQLEPHHSKTGLCHYHTKRRLPDTSPAKPFFQRKGITGLLHCQLIEYKGFRSLFPCVLVNPEILDSDWLMTVVHQEMHHTFE